MSKQINGQGNQKTKGIILITDLFFFIYNVCFKKTWTDLSKFFLKQTLVSLYSLVCVKNYDSTAVHWQLLLHWKN